MAALEEISQRSGEQVVTDRAGAYRAGTGAGGRNKRDRARAFAAGRFAATRFPLSMDSR